MPCCMCVFFLHELYVQLQRERERDRETERERERESVDEWDGCELIRSGGILLRVVGEYLSSPLLSSPLLSSPREVPDVSDSSGVSWSVSDVMSRVICQHI